MVSGVGVGGVGLVGSLAPEAPLPVAPSVGLVGSGLVGSVFGAGAFGSRGWGVAVPEVPAVGGCGLLTSFDRLAGSSLLFEPPVGLPVWGRETPF